ncbi:hypothetical protein C2E23DRAFT_852229 [Lenzites betulinus]|nr:hypothetical protein C2E23DRAFT_852229 [Lenzites betulinus]
MHFKGWFELIQGPTLTVCDATKDQHHLLLHIALWAGWQLARCGHILLLPICCLAYRGSTLSCF